VLEERSANPDLVDDEELLVAVFQDAQILLDEGDSL